MCKTTPRVQLVWAAALMQENRSIQISTADRTFRKKMHHCDTVSMLCWVALSLLILSDSASGLKADIYGP